MRGLQKSKRVSWASDLSLCQVKLFLSEDCPSQVGLSVQDHLQAKPSFSLHPTGAASDENLPPGFEGIQPVNLLKNKLSQISLTKWKCPPRYLWDPTWQVVAGDESKEVEIENQREMRMLEAVYPRPSAIPLNPSYAFDVEDCNHDDQLTPLIPITPIEDEDDNYLPADTQTMRSVPQTLDPSALSPQHDPGQDLNHVAEGVVPAGIEPSILSAAYNALSAAMTNNDQANVIDPNLLIKILSNPSLVEKLVAAHGSSPCPQISSDPTTTGICFSNYTPQILSNADHTPGTFCAMPSRLGPHPVPNLPRPPPLGGPVKKDINYFKSLIQQHGEEKQEQVGGSMHRDPKQKINKPCIYFNSSRGCRHGANCAYQHDSSSQQRVSSLNEAQGAKRLKMDREITGT